MKWKDGYYFDRTIKFDNAIVRVYRPILTDEEHERRMKKIHDSAAALLREKITTEAKYGSTNHPQ